MKNDTLKGKLCECVWKFENDDNFDKIGNINITLQTPGLGQLSYQS